MGLYIFLTFFLILFSILNYTATTTYNVYVDTYNPVHTVPPEFLSYALDMSIIVDTDDYWGLNFSFIEPLASALGPAYLRFGGTSTSRLVFKNTRTYNNTTLNGSDWNTSTWNSSNAQDFMNYAGSKGYIMDFELGNEPELYESTFHKTLSGKQIAQDYHDLRMLLNNNALYKNSKVAGPALSGVGYKTSDALIKEIFDNGGQNYIDYFTFHHYYMGYANFSDWINPKVMDSLIPELKAAKNLNRSSLWLGETGSTWNNDVNADKFIAGFWWIDKLGLSALYKLDVVVRFVFFGGTLTLISDPPYMKPVTDYWLCFLYKKLIGQQVYNVSFAPANPYLRLYASSSIANDGSFVLYGMTLTNDTLTLDLPQIQNKQVTLYLVQASTPGNLLSDSTLNGQFLEWNRHLFYPNYIGNITSLPLELPGFSQFFLVVNQTKSYDCPDGWYKETSNSNKCLKFVDQKQPMVAAKFACSVYGANASILSIENAFENNEITKQTNNQSCNSFYTGLIRWSANSTYWQWVNVDKGTYRNWSPGYPVGSPTHFCSIFNAQTGTWMDTDCDMSYCYICQLYI